MTSPHYDVTTSWRHRSRTVTRHHSTHALRTALWNVCRRMNIHYISHLAYAWIITMLMSQQCMIEFIDFIYNFNGYLFCSLNVSLIKSFYPILSTVLFKHVCIYLQHARAFTLFLHNLHHCVVMCLYLLYLYAMNPSGAITQ